jgi:hypothetical protein
MDPQHWFENVQNYVLWVCVQGQKASNREEAGGRSSGAGAGPRVDYNFDHLDRERYSHSKKKLEVRKSEKLAAALSVFDSGCDVEVMKAFLPQKQVFLSIKNGNLCCRNSQKMLV